MLRSRPGSAQSRLREHRSLRRISLSAHVRVSTASAQIIPGGCSRRESASLPDNHHTRCLPRNPDPQRRQVPDSTTAASRHGVDRLLLPPSGPLDGQASIIPPAAWPDNTPILVVSAVSRSGAGAGSSGIRAGSGSFGGADLFRRASSHHRGDAGVAGHRAPAQVTKKTQGPCGIRMCALQTSTSQVRLDKKKTQSQIVAFLPSSGQKCNPSDFRLEEKQLTISRCDCTYR